MDSIVLFLNCFVTLFSVLDPFGATVIFLAMTSHNTAEHRADQVYRAMLASSGILIAFTIAGGAIFAIFGISTHALIIAGGLILLQIGFKMLAGEVKEFRSTNSEMAEAEQMDDIAIIPMAIPMLAGPAAITTMIVFADKAEGAVDWIAIFAAMGAALLGTYIILQKGEIVAKALGETGMRVLTRIMGLILLAMGIEFILSGAKGYFG